MRIFAQKQHQHQTPASSSFTRSNTAILGLNHHANPLLHLQRTIGNQAVRRMLQTHAEELNAGLNGTASPLVGHDFSRIPIHPPTAAIQTKRAINTPGDEYEQEADRVLANQVLAASAQTGVSGALPHIQGFSGASTGQMDVVSASIDQALARPGTPWESALRQDREQRFGHDFGSGFERSVARLSPMAFPSAAVIQPKLRVGEPNDKFEQEADRVADKVMKMPEALPPVTAMSTSASVQLSSAIQPHFIEGVSRGGQCPRRAEKEKIEHNTLTETTTALIQRKPGDVNEPKNQMSRKEEDKKAELEFHSTVAFNSAVSGYSPTGPPTEEGFAAILIRWAVWNTGWKTAPEHVDRLTIYKADRCSGCRDEKDEVLTVNVTTPSIVSITQPGKGESEYEGINQMIGMSIRAGHYDVYVDLDVYDEVEEINEDNNTAFTTFYVKPHNKSEPDIGEE